MAAKNRKKKKRMSGRKKILLFSAEILLLFVIVAAVAVWKGTFGKIQFDRPLTATEAGINEDIAESTLLTMNGYTNIALFGLDNRSEGRWDSGNSDAIMVASINNDTKEVRIVSVYRDTYMNVGRNQSGEDVYRKVNSAYARGGITNAVRCLNENLDLNIMAYICVDWNALVEAIDALGGVEITINDFEVDKINFYIKETAKGAGVKAHKVKKAGKQTLDGAQATSYARIRYGKGLDMLRSSRQRIVIQAMLKKAKSSGFTTLAKVCNAVFDDIQTSLSLSDILYLAKNLSDYELVETSGFPKEFVMKSVGGQDSVIPADLCSNVVELHRFLFAEEDYQPSQTVLDRNNATINLTGVTIENSEKVDFANLGNIVGADGTDALWEQKASESSETSAE